MANYMGIALDRSGCKADETEFLKSIYFLNSGLSFTYYAGGAIIAKLGSEMPEDNNMETYQGLRLTDRWYSVRLVDYATRSTPKTLIPFGNITVGYGAEGAVAETNMPVLITDWAEQGGGDYWLQMGLTEFANFGKYTVRVSSNPVGLFADRSFIVDVESVVDYDLGLHLGAGVGGRNIGNILGALAQSKFERRLDVKAVAPVPAQGIDALMVARGCIEYQRVIVSYTFNWAAPDYTFDLLYYYDASRSVYMISI